MFTKVFFMLAALTSVLAIDATRQATIPSGETLDEFCANWTQTCIDIAHREGKAYDVCATGYTAGTAKVDCLALNGETPAPQYTIQVAEALNVTLV